MYMRQWTLSHKCLYTDFHTESKRFIRRVFVEAGCRNVFKISSGDPSMRRISASGELATKYGEWLPGKRDKNINTFTCTEHNTYFFREFIVLVHLF
jgi:hypothetical protein